MRIRDAKFLMHVLSYVLLMNVLVYAYLEYQVPIWGYIGYTADYAVDRHIISNVGTVLLALIIPMRMSGLTSFILALVASSMLASMLALYAARGYSTGYLASVLIFVLIVRLLAEHVRFRIPPRKSSTTPILLVSAGTYGVCLAWIAARGGLSNMNFDLSRIYLMRDDASERYSVGLFAYLLSWGQKIFGTTVFALGIVKNSAFLISFVVLGHIFLFATLAQKSPLAMLVFVIAAIAVAKYRPMVSLLNVLLISFIVAAIIIYENGAIEPLALIVMRVFFEPSGNSVFFFEFFSENKFTFFSTSFLKGIVDYPYDTNVFDLISMFRLGEARINPNVGILGTGYQHMGYFGLLFYAILAGLILATLETLGKGTPSWVPLAIAGPSMYIMFTSTDMTVALLTNGGIIAILMLFLWPTANTSTKATLKRLSA